MNERVRQTSGILGPGLALIVLASLALGQGGGGGGGEGEPSSLDALPDFGAQLTKMLVVLAALLVALVLALKLLPRLVRGRAARSFGPGRIEVLERRPLEGRASLYLVRVGQRVYLLGLSEAGWTRLSGDELEAQPPEGGALPSTRSFAERLAAGAQSQHPGAST